MPQRKASKEVNLAVKENVKDRYQAARSDGLWRPWLTGRRDVERVQCGKRQQSSHGPVTRSDERYNHPVTLYWPKSRCSEHLFEAGEALLINFPVQATISFYEESDSESEADSSDDNHDSGIELE